MAADKHIIFFLEDAAQESLIPGLFKRLISDLGLPSERFHLKILYARGGASLRALTDFITDSKKYAHLNADLLVVGSDANCKGFTVRRDWIAKKMEKTNYSAIISAIADPHIERWYMLDMKALAKVAGVPLSGCAPAYKCEKNHYKRLLREAFRDSGIVPPLGGTEYGPLLATEMNLYEAGKRDHGLKEFLKNVRAWLKHIKTAK